VGLRTVEIRPVGLQRLEPLIGPERAAAFWAVAARAREFFAGRRVVNVNSTPRGGGVAELLQTLLAYARGAGIDTQWAVISGTPEFFDITKRLHNRLYGQAGDGGPLGADQRRVYEAVARESVADLLTLVRPRDLVLLHDPQPAPLVAPLRAAGARVIWRCHVGIDHQNEHSATAWDFLRPYIEPADGFVFSRRAFAPSWIPEDRLAVVAPSIDPFAAKNGTLGHDELLAVLRQAGVLAAGAGDEEAPRFTRRDGSVGQLVRRVDTVGTGVVPSPSVPVVLQASGWDALKDMPGVMEGFARHCPMPDAHLVLAGPDAQGVADDPEAGGVLAACVAHRQGLPEKARRRIHLVCVPLADPDEAATVVNALQRHATVVVQKSLAEGFGLTVAEAMWKHRPVVGSAVGGILDQIVPDVTGVLIDDPHDLAAFGDAVARLLDDPGLAAGMGAHGHEQARTYFLADRHLSDWAAVFSVLGAE
jgi:trehalose synthase